MLRFLSRRLGLTFLVIMGVMLITFFLARVVPGDPAVLFAGGERATAEGIERARELLNLDEPLPVQFVLFVNQIIHGDLGKSFLTQRSVADDLLAYSPATLELIVPALLIAVAIGVPVGILAGSKRGGRLDGVAQFSAISGIALPTFWVALMGQIVFSSVLGILPVAGRISTDVSLTHPVTTLTGSLVIDAALQGNWTAWTNVIWHLVLPVLVLAILPTCLVLRMVRAGVGEVMDEAYVLAARAAGIPGRVILFRYVLKNAISSTLTVLGLAFASAFVSTVLVEVIFSWPGIGQYVTRAILSSDFPAIQGVVLVGAFLYVGINLMVDIIQATIDPRIRLG